MLNREGRVRLRKGWGKGAKRGSRTSEPFIQDGPAASSAGLASRRLHTTGVKRYAGSRSPKGVSSSAGDSRVCTTYNKEVPWCSGTPQETGAGRLLWASEEGESVKELLRPKDGQRKAERSGNTPPRFAEGKPLTLWMENQNRVSVAKRAPARDSARVELDLLT